MNNQTNLKVIQYQPGQNIELSNYDGTQFQNVYQNGYPLLPQNLIQTQQHHKNQKQLISNVALIFLIWSVLTLYLEFKVVGYFDGYYPSIEIPLSVILLYIISYMATKPHADETIPSILIFGSITLLTVFILISIVKCFPNDRDLTNDGFQITLQGLMYLFLLIQTILNGIGTLIIYVCLVFDQENVRFQRIAIIILIFSGFIFLLLLSSFISIVLMLIYSFLLLSSLRRVYKSKEKITKNTIALTNIVFLGMILPIQFE